MRVRPPQAAGHGKKGASVIRHIFIINPAAGKRETTRRLEEQLSRLSVPHERESIVETQKETSKRKRGKDMEEEALKGTDMRSILDTGLGINPMEEGLNRLP